MDRILIYTDGSSRGNPGPGGWGAIVATAHEVIELGRHEAHTTNNRMELLAVFEALSYAAGIPSLPIVVRSDSSYVINGATKWSFGWQKRGWMTLDNKDVSNRDLWEPMIALVKSLAGRLVWERVGGHIAIPGNERADTIATSFALREHIDLFHGVRAMYEIDLENVSFDVEKKEKKTSSKTKSTAKAYSYVSAVGGVVMTHATWDECKTRVHGKAARFKKSTSAADEARIKQEFSI